jgi:Domain of unknown function (DUF1905)/Bacteriocin-protection, YdeI or OmpD-Associated/Mobilization protein NikA
MGEALTEEESARAAREAYEHRDEVDDLEQVRFTVDADVRSVISVHFNRGELERIEAAARQAGMPVSTYIRHAALVTSEMTDETTGQTVDETVDLDTARAAAQPSKQTSKRYRKGRAGIDGLGDTAAMEFRTTIELGGKTATGFAVPEEAVLALGAGKRPPIKVTIGDYTYRSTIAPMGGRFMVPVSAEVRKAAGVQAGDEVRVRLELDTEPRRVEAPDDFACALEGEPEAKRRFEAMSYSHQRQHVMAIEDAKTAQTRKRRIDKALAMLKEGR